MPDSQSVFHSADGRRRVLIVDDEAINRELLGAILGERYETIFAVDGAQALKRISENREALSLILLDLILPDLHGFEILKRIRADPMLCNIPVIVLTSDQNAEVESLTLGASDFISKPYPMPEVVLARVLKTIELFEGRDIIRSTERDMLTGLYNREYFYRYVQQMDAFHRDLAMDAIVININHFHFVNERYGREYGDRVLKGMGEKLLLITGGSGGIVGRMEGDTFLIYTPHQEDYAPMMESLTSCFDTRVRLRMGIYPQADKTIDVERRFDRAKLAADKVRASFTKNIALYDKALHDAELFAEQLMEEFPRALQERQFKVFYQPKFDIRPDEPVLNSSEALVRWQHPRLGLMSPGVFIPLFESNGLIQQLDSYVWREVASQLKDWKERLGVSVPVSVNVSRVDMFDADLVSNMISLIEEFDLQPSDLLLEITESAYTQDSRQIVDTVNALRASGFSVEMDDFGSGYSSLNMISTLPVDALKLDMQFIRNAFKNRKNTKMLEVVIDIADSLIVPTIAEGVETAEQLFALKSLGCDIVQGYYFSKPVPPEEYEKFLIERKNARIEYTGKGDRFRPGKASAQFTYDALHDPSTGLYNHSGYEMLLQDADQAHIALLIASVDGYQALREDRGMAAADRLAGRVANVLRSTFRSVDMLCRISNDEFVVIMTRADSTIKNLILDKVSQMNAILSAPEGDLPPVTLSVGVAFGDRPNPNGDIFHDADQALTRMKQMKRSGCAIF